MRHTLLARRDTTTSVEHDDATGPFPSEVRGGDAQLSAPEPGEDGEAVLPFVSWPVAGVPAQGPDGGGTRRGWIAVVLIAFLVGAGAGLGAGAGVAATIRAHNTTDVKFSPNTSVFHGMNDVKAVLARVLPSVVAIQAFGPGCASGPFGAGTQSEEGSGMILTDGGEILTNDHVIADATQISVTFHGQKRAYPATLLGTDPSYDVALLQVRGPISLRAVSFGDSSTIAVGEDVLAIGNALDLSRSTPSVTEGIISAQGRSITAGGTTAPGPSR